MAQVGSYHPCAELLTLCKKVCMVRMEMERYIALFEYDENDGYGVIFPDLPGLATSGDDYDEAYRNGSRGTCLSS